MEIMQNGNCCECINSTTDDEKVKKKIGCITSLYAYLDEDFVGSRFLLNRNLSYTRNSQKSGKKSRWNPRQFDKLNRYPETERSLDGICEYLRLNVGTSVGLNGGTAVDRASRGPRETYQLRFRGFFDGDSECEWETIQASISIEIVHQWNCRRKWHFGRRVSELLPEATLICNMPTVSGEDAGETGNSGETSVYEQTFSRLQLFDSTCDLQITYSYLLFHIRAQERRKRSPMGAAVPANIGESSAPLTSDVGHNQVYAVNYEAKLPFFKKGDINGCNYLADGEYELRLELSESQPEAGDGGGGFSNVFQSSVEQRQRDNDEEPQSAVVENGADDELDSGSSSCSGDECSSLSGPRVWVPSVEETQQESRRIREYSRWPRLLFQLAVTVPSAPDSNFTETPYQPQPALVPIVNGHGPKRPSSSPQVTNRKKPRQNGTQKQSTVNSSVGLDFIYKFYNRDSLIQWTKTEEPKCPWCKFCRPSTFSVSVKSGIRCLLRHLQTFHSRFSFKSHHSPSLESGSAATAAAQSNRVVVFQVRLNESHDGSVEVGLRRFSDTGRNSSHNWRPQRRQTFWQLIYCRSLHYKLRDPAVEMKPAAKGHNRIYVHTTTGIPLQSAADMDVDSEVEDHPEWLLQQYHKRLQEFTDVNPGEKRIMQLWNSHLLSRKYHGDRDVPTLTSSFIKERGPQIKEEGLRCNLILHLANLADYGLLTVKELVDAFRPFDAQQ